MEVQVTLTVVEGVDEGLSVRLENPQAMIGRKDCDLTLHDRKVSHQHAALEISGDEVKIIDLESRNGILVNGKKVSRARLSNLDEIRMGFTKIKVLIVEDLNAFKNRNSPDEVNRTVTEPKAREPRRRDIHSMIDDELKRFSKWDLSPETESMEEPEISHRGCVLEVLEGPDAGKRIRIEKSGTTLGRGKADISFGDSDISRIHATIDIYGKGHAVIRDLGSTNGTYVNKKKITEAKLADGDRIQLGGTLCRFVVEE
jgi:pSer/pThr/pTyr-binding forkhead associated (FHA) protein